jgi:cytochrome c oxidase subunit 2
MAATLVAIKRSAVAFATAVVFFLTATAAIAQNTDLMIGQSAPKQLDLQEMVTPIGYAVADLHHFMLVIITGITIFVLALLLIVIIRYNTRANPKAATWTHNTALEIAWTLAPVVILAVIAIPSVRLLQLQEDFTKVQPDVVIKATGYQWYWGYSYANEGIAFDATMLGGEQPVMNAAVRAELEEYGYPESAWKLATDNAMVVPVNKTVLMQITAADVIHSWTIPAFAVKGDGIPGRVNQQWFRAEKEGVFYGQCSELCGRNHAYMPITVRVVSDAEYAKWVACSQQNDVSDCAPSTVNEWIAKKKNSASLDLASNDIKQVSE